MSDRSSEKAAEFFAETLSVEENDGPVPVASAAADDQFRKFINAIDASVELLNASWDHPSTQRDYGPISAVLSKYDIARGAARNHALALSGYHTRTELGGDKSDWILCYKYAEKAKLWSERALSLLENGKANFIQLRSRRKYDEAYLEAKAQVSFISAEMGYVIVEVYPTAKNLALNEGTATYIEIEEQLRSYVNDSDQLGPGSNLSILRSLYQLGIETTEEMLQKAVTLLTDAHEGLRGFMSNPLSDGSPKLVMYFKSMSEALHYRGVVRRYLSYYQSGFMSKFYMKEAEADVKKSLSLYTDEFEKRYAKGQSAVNLALDMAKATFSSFRISLQLTDKTQEAREAFKHHLGLLLFVRYSETLPLYPLADIKNEIFSAASPSGGDIAPTNQGVLDWLLGRENESREECDSSNNRRDCFDLAANLLSIAYYQMMMGLYKSSYKSFDKAMDVYDSHLLEGETPMQYFDIKGGFPVPENVSIDLLQEKPPRNRSVSKRRGQEYKSYCPCQLSFTEQYYKDRTR